MLITSGDGIGIPTQFGRKPGPGMPALRHNPMRISDLIIRASSGDEAAWRELVSRYAPIVWAVARTHRLRGADAADAAQNTWIALAEHLPRLRRPDRLPAWLATTARRECLRIATRVGREIPLDGLEIAEPPVFHTDGERHLWTAFARLPRRCRELLGLLAHAPKLTYAQLSRALGLKVTSIGRTRGRCLDQLRRALTLVEDVPE